MRTIFFLLAWLEARASLVVPVEEHDVGVNSGRSSLRVGVPDGVDPIVCPTGLKTRRRDELCKNLDVALKCREACAAVLTQRLVEAKQPLRSSVTPSWHPASDQRMAMLQSIVEHLTLEAGGSRADVPHFIHEAALSASDVLQSGVSRFSTTNTEARQLQAARVGEELGYPLTVILSYLLRLPSVQSYLPKFGWHVGANGTYPVAYEVVCGLAPVVTEHGYSAAESRRYYEDHIAMVGEHSEPLVDGAWIYEFLGTAHTFGLHYGKHYYHKVPSSPAGSGYDYNYSVYNFPDLPLRLGVLADWPTGAPAGHHVLEELAKLQPDLLVHLGDTYYAGTYREQMDFLINPVRATFGVGLPVYLIPGNHDYYSSGQGFYAALAELGFQNASYFCLRNPHWQILALDTGLVDNDQLSSLLPLLPDDQLSWALFQLDEGQRLGIKTIVMSHHQFFSHTESLGVANDELGETMSLPDRVIYNTYSTVEYDTKSVDLPGHLPNEQKPAVNTRLLHQFSPSRRAYASAFYWGHEHSSAIYDSFANISRGRLIGNGAISSNIDFDVYRSSNLTSSPWGREEVPLLPMDKGSCQRDGCRTGQGNAYWDLGFVTIDLNGSQAIARHWEVQSTHNLEGDPYNVSFSAATVFFEETY